MPRETFLHARGRGLVRVAFCLLAALPAAATAWGADTPDKAPRVSRLLPMSHSVADESVVLKLVDGAPEQPGLLGRYRMALEKESRRRLDRNPGLFQVQTEDEEGNPVKRSRNEARKIFGGATGRLLNDFAEILIEDAVALQAAKSYVQGIRLDVMSGGNVRFQARRDDRASRFPDDLGRTARGDDVAASFSLIAIGSPRLEMRATLPGAVRTQIELPLSEPGLRATFSRRLSSHLRGTLSAGVEDSGSEMWATVGVGVRF